MTDQPPQNWPQQPQQKKGGCLKFGVVGLAVIGALVVGLLILIVVAIGSSDPEDDVASSGGPRERCRGTRRTRRKPT